MSSERVAEVRAFNRFYTRVIGLLQAGLVGTPYSLVEARVLYELAQGDSIETAQLKRLLDLDAGYLSRIMARFSADGLVSREQSTVDARRQVIRLTDQGRAAFAELDGRQVAAVEELIQPLAVPEQLRLINAMSTIREVLGHTPRPPGYLLRPPDPGDLGWVVARHGALYAAEYGWDASFEVLVARVVADYGDNHDPRRERVWIAEIDGEQVGCVFCVAADEATAKLRLLLVEPSARGMGIGGRLVGECLRFARRAGYSGITLWTNDVLTDARRIYERAGFHLDEENAHHSFGQDLVGQNWSRDL